MPPSLFPPRSAPGPFSPTRCPAWDLERHVAQLALTPDLLHDAVARLGNSDTEKCTRSSSSSAPSSTIFPGRRDCTGPGCAGSEPTGRGEALSGRPEALGRRRMGLRGRRNLQTALRRKPGLAVSRVLQLRSPATQTLASCLQLPQSFWINPAPSLVLLFRP